MSLSQRVLTPFTVSDLPGGYAQLVALLVAAVPALNLIVDHGGSVPTFLLFCMGIGTTLRQRLWTSTTRHEWWLLGAFAIFCTVSVAWAGYGGWTEPGVDKMQEHLRLLQFIPIYLLLRHVGLSQDVLWAGLVIGAIGVGISAVVEVFWQGMARADGNNNAIAFGNISVIMGFGALGGLPLYAARGRYWLVLPWLALAAGVTACILSGARGAMLFLPLGIAVAAIYLAPALGRRTVVLLVAVPLLVFVAALALPSTNLSARLGETVDVLAAYEPGERESGSSLGKRFDMWLSSARVIAEHPITGVGLGRFREAMEPYVKRGMANASILVHGDAHNVYIDTQLSRGLTGTLALLMLLGIPLAIGLRGMLHPDRRAHAWAYAVVIIVAGYATQGLSSQLFELGPSLSFFVTPLAAAIAGLENARCVAADRP